MESYDKFNLTLPEPKQKELEELIRQYSTVVTYPAKTVFLEPGSVLDGVYYIASGRTRHYMVALDGTEKILYTLTNGWFYGETPCSRCARSRHATCPSFSPCKTRSSGTSP